MRDVAVDEDAGARRGRRIPLSLTLASALVLTLAVAAMAVLLVALPLALIVVAKLHQGMAALALLLLSVSLLGIEAVLLLAAIRARHLDPWTRPVLLGVGAVSILGGIALITAGAPPFGVLPIAFGASVAFGVISPSARAAFRTQDSGRRPPVPRCAPVRGAVAAVAPAMSVVPGPAPAAPVTAVPAPTWRELLGFPPATG